MSDRLGYGSTWGATAWGGSYVAMGGPLIFLVMLWLPSHSLQIYLAR